MLQKLSKGLIVSCQPVVGGPMDSPAIISAMAQAAIHGGASGVRIEGVINVETVRAAVDRPIIGIVKVDLVDSPVRITPFIKNINDLVSAGADIVAVDATNRPRPETVADAMEAIRSLGTLSMADCSCLEDGINAQKLGADILGTTMSGYTTQEVPETPDLELVSKLAKLNSFVIAEGRYNTPGAAASAMLAGANSVVVGSAITRTEVVTGWFLDAITVDETVS